ncbi:MAG: hypothetical protein LBI18_06760 [Planctomycetaceae bacterium]|nr:hypothetical protein [Planctomycetaceae bacterium]
MRVSHAEFYCKANNSACEIFNRQFDIGDYSAGTRRKRSIPIMNLGSAQMQMKYF